MYTQYFGFRKPPFKLTPDSGFFYSNAVFLDAHSSLLDAIDEQRGMNLLTGEHGTGKTTLLKRLAQDLDETVHLVFLENSNLTIEDLVGCLLDKLGIAEAGQTRLAIESEIIQLRDHLESLAGQQQGCVLFIDDAQNLPSDTLNALPLLLQSEDGKNLLQIVLSASPELPVRLTDPGMSAVSKLVAVQARLDRLPANEIAAFIDHQIRVAGSMRSDIFSEPAIREITQTTSGRPRDINQVCDKALEIAYRQRTQVVTREIIRQTSSPAWLEMETAQKDTPSPVKPIKTLISKAAESISRPTLLKTPNLPKGALTGPKQLATQVTKRIAPLLGSLANNGASLGKPMLSWGRKTLDRLGIVLLIAIAKLWKFLAHTSILLKHLFTRSVSAVQGLSRQGSFRLRRRHAWIAAGLAVIAAFIGLLAIAPEPGSEQLAQRTTSETASGKALNSSEEQTAAEESSGRQLSQISELRAVLAQRDLDLKTTTSNRNYLQKRVAALTKERDDLTIKNSQIKFAHDQLELTLAATLKQLADVKNDLTTARALARLPGNDLDSGEGSAKFVGTSGNAVVAQPVAPDPEGTATSADIAVAQSPSTSVKELEGTSPETAEVRETEIVSLNPVAPDEPMDYISDTADPLVTETSSLVIKDDDTPIIAGIPQITEDTQPQATDTDARNASPDKLNAASQQTTALSAPADELPKAAKRTFSDHTVALLLHKARRLYLKDMLTTPAGNNAYEVYQQILEGYPGQSRAIAGIEKIAGRYLDWAKAEVQNGNNTKALRYYKKALSVLPEDPEIAAQIAALEGTRPTSTSTAAPLPAAPKPERTAEAVQREADPQQSEAARARLKTLRIEVSERSLLRSVEAGNLEITGLLIDAGISPDAQNTSKQTALLTAAINGDKAITRLLLERGANVNKTNSMGRSPLLAAAWNGNAALVSILLDGGAEIESTSNEGWNALMYAAWNGHASTVRALLKKGVKVDAVNAQGWTALMNAAWNGHSEAVRVLLEHGANPGHETPAGETALLVASQQGHRETALLLE
ncbi:ankyrin repeat domain-containing protein [Denitrobaculum tricleocarpae]|uniref:AAA family ATPase n=1 Tax=Denitrobaculum tricleocarpae TaxID=2591009 RepID=A0A545TU86_9PROT|nr:ankyrin repeat domain-containing protein [Denitrobaculum tricleocarpae]TQV80777.1 AAA family ATPase [Denitrobaculum tricleocarpae]